MSEFLAEARVLVTPDTTKFRGLLEAQLRVATGTPVSVPVLPVFTGVGGAAAATDALVASQRAATATTLGLASAAQVENSAFGRQAVILDAVVVAETEAAAAAQRAGLAKGQQLVNTRALTAAQTAGTVAATKYAATQTAVAGAASEVGAAQVILSRSTLAVASAEVALVKALSAKNIALIDAASQSLRLAEAQALEAETALAAARAQAAHAASLGNVSKAGIASAAGLIGLRGAVLTAGAGFIAATVGFQAAVKSIQSAADLEEELNVFQATADATADEMERVSQAATALGRDLTLPGVTAQDAAVAMTTLAKAGLGVQESIDGARGTLQLAVAAQTDFASAADLIANSLNSFGLAGDDAVRVADLLAASSNEAQGSIADMGLALKQSAAVAQLAGLNIEETVTILTQLSRAGLSSSDAGTSFRTALIRLIKPTKDVNAALDQLDVQLRDITTGAIRPEVFGEIGEALEDLAPAQQQFITAQLGGADAVRAFGLAAQQGTIGFQQMRDAVTQGGEAAELAGARTQGFTGDVENLSNQVSSLGTTLGQIALPPLSLLVTQLANLASTANTAASAVQTLTEEARGLGSAFAEQVPFIDRAGGAIGKFVEARIKLALFGPVLFGVTTAMEHFGDSTEEAGGKVSVFDNITKGVTGTIQGLTNALKGALDSTAAAGGAEGLNVQQVLNRVLGFDSAETRARIRGDTEEILSVLQDEQAFLEAQLQRDFVKRRPGLQRQLENALFGVVSDIGAISASGAADAKSATAAAAAEAAKAAAEAVRIANQADQDLIAALSQRRDDAGRRIAAAAETEGLNDDIRRQNQLQALIKQQIEKIRDRIRDEKTRKSAIRELRIALIESRAEEDALRRQQIEDAQARQQEAINLDIEFAEITGNVSREVAARMKLIALLKKQQGAVKKGTAEWKRLRNEIAQQQAAIKAAREQNEEAKDEGRGFAGQAFDFLQTQQGFAANLLGNLIPSSATGGLVGGQTNISAQVQAQGQTKSGGPTFGQAATEVDILKEMLRVLRAIQSGRSHPEASFERGLQSAVMDGVGGGGGSGQSVN